MSTYLCMGVIEKSATIENEFKLVKLKLSLFIKSLSIVTVKSFLSNRTL